MCAGIRPIIHRTSMPTAISPPVQVLTLSPSAANSAWPWDAVAPC
ncbi:hypothetical protein [Streptomyces sp. NPDC059455]